MKSPNHPKLIIALALGIILAPISHVYATSAAEMNQKANEALQNIETGVNL